MVEAKIWGSVKNKYYPENRKCTPCPILLDISYHPQYWVQLSCISNKEQSEKWKTEIWLICVLIYCIVISLI